MLMCRRSDTMQSVIEELQDKQAHLKSPGRGRGTSILASSHSPPQADTSPSRDGSAYASSSDTE